MDNSINSRIRNLEDKFLLLKNDRDRLIEKVDVLKGERDKMIQNMDIRSKAIDFIEEVASNERISVKEHVEQLITDCLHKVYDDTYSVEFEYGVRGSKTSVEIHMVRKCDDGIVVRRKIDGIGGGVADTMAFPLKLIVLLNDGEFDKVLVTDEPGKHLDKDRVRNFFEFVREVSHRLGVQIILSSHWDVAKEVADTVYEVSLDDSVSIVKRVK